MPSLFIALAAINGFIAVGLGAFAAHGLKNRLPEDMLAIFQTGVQYQMYHALALFGVIFSGSLYVLSLSGVRWLGAITPIGGVAFLIGWALLAFAMLAGRTI